MTLEFLKFWDSRCFHISEHEHYPLLLYQMKNYNKFKPVFKVLYFFFKNNFIYLFLAVLGLWWWMSFSVVAVSGGYCLPVVCRLLTAVASLVAELGVLGIWASAVSYGFSFFRACGIFLDQGLNLYFLHWQADFLPLSSTGKSKILYFWSINIKYFEGKIFKCLEVYEFLAKEQKFRFYYRSLCTSSGKNSISLLGDIN